LLNVGFFGHAASLHADLVRAPFGRALFRGLCEGWRYGDAACDRSGDKQTMMDLHLHSPDSVPASSLGSIQVVVK
jgi:hypothetical protein